MSSPAPTPSAPLRLTLGSRAAREAALVACVAAWRAEDPFVPVVVLVPNGATADRVHELLAGTGARLGVEARTLEQQATRRVERAGPWVGPAGAPVPTTGLPPGASQLVVRCLLASDRAPAVLARLADRPGLLDATGAALRDLVDADLGPCEPVGPLGGLHDAHLDLRAELGVVDDSARFDRAAGLAPTDPVERLLLFGLYDPTGLQERLVAAELLAATEAVVLAPPHGRPLLERLEPALAARGSVREALAEPGLAGDPAGGATTDGPRDPDPPLEVLSLPTGLVGARLLAERLAGLLAGGDLAPADLAVVHRGSGGVPADLLVDELGALGVPVAAGVTLGEVAPGSFLLALGRVLAGPRVSRAGLLDALALAPGVAPATLARWDRLARDAGLRLLLDGGEALRGALGRLTYQAGRLEEATGEAAARRDSLPALVALLKALDSLHRALQRGTPWGALGRRLTTVLDDAALLDGADPTARAAWTEHLAALAGLERFGLPADPLGLGRVLADVAGRTLPGRAGGVTLAPLARCRGGRWRRVVLLDADEGSFPREAPPDPLLDDATRARLADRAPGLVHDVDAEERALLAELRDLAADGLTLCTTRPGVEGKAVPGPSRYLLELLADPDPPALADLTDGTAAGVTRLDLGDLWRGAPADAAGAEAAALRAVGLGLDPAALRAHVGTLAGGRRAELEAARLDRPGATPWDGHLAGTAAHADLVASGELRGVGRNLSASTLEGYAACGLRSLLQRWLGVDEHEDPDQRRGLDVRDRGKVVHDVLEAFGAATLDAGLVPWRRRDLARLRQLLAAAIDAQLERLRRVSPAQDLPLWEAEADRYRGQLGRWLQEQLVDDDAAWIPLAVEWAFEDQPYPLLGGGELRLTGRVDRVDRSPDGAAVRVVDYKTGGTGGALPGTTGGGRRLQAHLYGVAARAHHGAHASQGLYDHVLSGVALAWDGIDQERSRGPGKRVEGDGAAARQVAALVAGLEAGRFEPLPRGDRTVDRRACDTCGMAEACGPWRDRAHTALEAAGEPVLAALTDAVDLRHLDGPDGEAPATAPGGEAAP